MGIGLAPMMGVMAGANLLSGWMGSNAAQGAASEQSAAAIQAAQIQAQSVQAQLAQQQSMYNSNVARQQPWVTQGGQAASTLSDLMGTSGNTGAAGYGSLTHQFGASDLASNLAPNYAFQLDQGNQALAAQQSATGNIGSGQGAKDAVAYNQNFAGSAYQNAFNNYTTNQSNLYNRLSGISALGQNAAAGVGNQGVQVANSMSSTMQSGTTASNNYLTGAAAAGAAGQVGSANAWSSGLSGGINNALTLNYLNNMPGANGVTPWVASPGASGSPGYNVPPQTNAQLGLPTLD